MQNRLSQIESLRCETILSGQIKNFESISDDGFLLLKPDIHYEDCIRILLLTKDTIGADSLIDSSNYIRLSLNQQQADTISGIFQFGFVHERTKFLIRASLKPTSNCLSENFYLEVESVGYSRRGKIVTL